ncbi:MAG: hypothetical protein DRN12_05785 [Thermoplasmata archaeon]|nr:MAG: hypothetical protein DRN12_05785 [Thermoplasmata archaeon]
MEHISPAIMMDICERYCYRLIRKPVDITPRGITNLRLVLFDMDGVLTDTGSSWRYIHNYFGVSNEESVDLYLKGEIDYHEFIRRDVNLWRENGKLIEKDKLEEILSDIPLMKGADKLIEKLHEYKIKTAIVSAGLDILADKVAKKIGIDYIYANGIKIDENGRLTGEGIVNVRLIYKDQTVDRISRELNIGFNEMIAVGNSCFDIPMLQRCGIGIAFNPEDRCIEETADVIVKEKNLELLLSTLNRYL